MNLDALKKLAEANDFTLSAAATRKLISEIQRLQAELTEEKSRALSDGYDASEQISDLLDELAELRKDAEAYKIIRDLAPKTSGGPCAYEGLGSMDSGLSLLEGEELDAAIEAFRHSEEHTVTVKLHTGTLKPVTLDRLMASGNVAKMPEESFGLLDYSKPIPRLPGEFLTWPGKAEGKPPPPITWIE